MEIGKVMNMAEFDVAYNAYRDRLMREGTIRTILDWTPAQENHLRFRFAKDFNLNLDTSVRKEVFGDDEQETRGHHDSIYPLSFFDEAFAAVSQESASDPIPLGGAYDNDLWTAPEQGATFAGPANANGDSNTMAPLVQQDYGFSGRGPFKGNPNVFMGSGIEVNGRVNNGFVEVASQLPRFGIAGYIPDHCIDPRLLETPQASDETSAGFASTSEAIAAVSSGRSPLISNPPAQRPGAKKQIHRPKKQGPSHKRQKLSLKKQAPAHKKPKPPPKTDRCSKPAYPIEGVTRQLRAYLGLNMLG